MAIFSRSKLASRVPSFHVPGLRRGSARSAVARAQQNLIRVGTACLSPSRWWARIASAAGVAVLLALSVMSLIAALVVTWPRS